MIAAASGGWLARVREIHPLLLIVAVVVIVWLMLITWMIWRIWKALDLHDSEINALDEDLTQDEAKIKSLVKAQASLTSQVAELKPVVADLTRPPIRPPVPRTNEIKVQRRVPLPPPPLPYV